MGTCTYFTTVTIVRLLRLSTEGGIDPVIPVTLMIHQAERLLKLPTEGGIDPVIPVVLMNHCLRLARLPTEGGIDPVMPGASKI